MDERRRPDEDARLVAEATSGEDWVTWSGGDKRPVSLNAKIEWKLRDGMIVSHRSFPVKRIDWRHEDLDSDVVAYRKVAA